MFRSVIFITCALIFVSFTAINCEECKESEPKCSSFAELVNRTDPFHKWWMKMCPENTTVVDQSDFDTYKNCIKTHLEPCIQDTVKIKQYFMNILQEKTIKWTDLCTHVVGNQVFEYLENSRGNRKIDMDMNLKEGTEKCSVLVEAYKRVEKCAGITDLPA